MNNKISLSKNHLVVAFMLLAVSCLVFCMSGCNVNREGIAATVGDTNIMEDEVTEYVEDFRTQNGLTSDAEWFTYLDTNGIKSSDLRSEILDEKIDEEVINQLAKKYGLTVSQQEIDKELQNTYSKMGSVEEFQASLQEYSMTMEEYTESLKAFLLETKVSKQLLKDAEIPEDLLNEFWAKYSTQMSGAKGYYEIIVPNDYAANAQKAYDSIKSGKSFTEVLNKVIEEDLYGLNFDYVTYEPFIQSPTEVKEKLKTMNVGDISEPIKTEYYTYILNVVDQITQEETWSISLLPEQTQEWIKEYAKNVSASEIYTSELEKQKEELGIIKYDMPAGLPYSKGMFS